MSGDAPELLDRGDVAVGGESRETVRVDSPESCLQRIDTAFWLFRAHWTEALSLNRVSPTEGASELCSSFSRHLDRDALQVGGSSQTRQQGVGNG